MNLLIEEIRTLIPAYPRLEKWVFGRIEVFVRKEDTLQYAMRGDFFGMGMRGEEEGSDEEEASHDEGEADKDALGGMTDR
jgi:hypothetical protein